MKLKLITLVVVATFFMLNIAISNAQTTNCDSVTTAFNSTGTVKYGAMFNVIATSSVTLKHLTANLNDGSAKIKIYYRNGSFIGHEQQPAAWTILDSATVLSNNTVTSTTIPTVIPINFNLSMVAGDTIAFYIMCPQLSFVYLTSTTSAWGTPFANDANIKVTVARSIYQTFGVPYGTPHIWNGSVSYCTAQAVDVADIANTNNFKVFESENKLFVNLNETSETNSKITVKLFNTLSQNVLQYQLNSGNTSYDLNNIADGIYYCALYKNNEQIEVKKISITKY